MQNTLLDWDPTIHLMNEIVTGKFSLCTEYVSIKQMKKTLFLKKRNESCSVAFLMYVLLF